MLEKKLRIYLNDCLIYYVHNSISGVSIELTKKELKWYDDVVKKYNKLQDFLEEKYEYGLSKLKEP